MGLSTHVHSLWVHLLLKLIVILVHLDSLKLIQLIWFQAATEGFTDRLLLEIV